MCMLMTAIRHVQYKLDYPQRTARIAKSGNFLLVRAMADHVNTALSPRIFRKTKASGGSFCCVPGCSNKCSKDKANGRHLTYFRFPLMDEKRTRLWLAQIRREQWFPKAHDRICGVHFEGGKKGRSPNQPGYIPTLFPARQRTVKQRTSQTSTRAVIQSPAPPAKRRRLFGPVKKVSNTIPHSPEDPSPRPHSPCSLDPREDHSPTDTTSTGTHDDDQSTAAIPNALGHMTEHDYISTTNDSEEYSPEVIQLHKHVQALSEEVNQLKSRVFSLDSCKDNTAEFKRVTSLQNYTQFQCLTTYLMTRCGGALKYWHGQDTDQNRHFAGKRPGRGRTLSFEEEFFMVLVKLRCGHDNKELSSRFGISASTVSRTFTTWINFLSSELTMLFEMPSPDRTCVATMPCFDDFPDVQIVLDCTELFSEMSSNLQARKETFSNYKHHDTVKFLVGLSPFQAINYVSEAWGGRASDKHITMNSEGLLTNLASGSSVMADRGFLVTEELKELGVDLIMPHFKGRNRPQMSEAESTKSAKISRARVHIERAIQRIKTFQLLKHCVTLKQKDLIQQIFKVCAYLTNMQSPIVKC